MLEGHSWKCLAQQQRQWCWLRLSTESLRTECATPETIREMSLSSMIAVKTLNQAHDLKILHVTPSYYPDSSRMQDPSQADCMVATRHAAAVERNQPAQSERDMGKGLPNFGTETTDAARNFRGRSTGEWGPVTWSRNRDSS